MRIFKHLSLRLKLLLVLTSITLSMLATYAFMALSSFKDDKIAYVFDSIQSQAKTTSQQIKTEISYKLEEMKVYLKGYSYQTKNFSSFSQKYFLQDQDLLVLESFIFEGKEFRSKTGKHLKKASLPSHLIKELNEFRVPLIHRAIKKDIGLRMLKDSPGHWALSLSFNDPKKNKMIVLIAIIKNAGFIELFKQATGQNIYLADHTHSILSGHTDSETTIDTETVKIAAKETKLNVQSHQGVYNFLSADQEDWLVSFSDVGYAGLTVFSMVPRNAALNAIQNLIIKSILFLTLLFFITIFVSVLSARSLTGALKKLFEATRKISQGDFNVHVLIESQDEVGGLAKGFNLMIGEIKRLLSETAEKARMQGELETAQTVQSTLFPELQYEEDHLRINGFYQPASECGGDWWYYNKIGSKIYLWIGDATGHGVSAALVTSAAKSASSIIEQLPDMPLPQILKLLNNAIYDTAKGDIAMTFFIACFDTKSHEFKYCNASHEAPILVPYKDDSMIKKADLLPLMENNGARMGEKKDSTYNESSVLLTPGDKIVFYTDGVTECTDHKGDMLGERVFLKSIVNSFNEGQSIDIAMNNLEETIENFRQGAPLTDDLTYFMFEYKKTG